MISPSQTARLTGFRLLLLLSILLAGCTTGGPVPGPTFTPPPPAEVISPQITLTPDSGPGDAPQPVSPVVPVATETAAPPTPVLPYSTATLQSLSHTCLRPPDYEPVVNRYLVQARQANLKDLWAEFDEQNPVYGLMSSFTDVSNTFSHATTYSKMLLVGEYPISINRPGAVGYVHCAVLIYMGGDEPEVGVGITDATLNETWSGFGYGLVRSEQEMRQYIQERIGKPVIVRYHVSQDPRDASFVRSGFFSPVMKLLWQNSYYTRFGRNPDMLKENVGQPRGPSMRELMVLLTSWPDEDVGLFLDYIIDPIL